MGEHLERSLRNIIEQRSLRFIFVGGKGGVGKTTCSSSLAIELSKTREKVLLVSTDPAHSTSDAFDQQFNDKPQLVKGFSNLYVMEVSNRIDENQLDIMAGEFRSLFSEVASSFPGIDEALSFSVLMQNVQDMHFSVVVFDTAPTGHTLRLLSFPQMVVRIFQQFIRLRSTIGGLFSQIANSVMGERSNGETPDVMGRMESLLKSAQQVVDCFKNPSQTTFVCVCIPEFLSLYETDRLITDLARFGIDTHNIIVNQIIVLARDHQCPLCLSRRRMQQRYLDLIEEFYGEDFSIVRLPLRATEVRGVAELCRFAPSLLIPEDVGTYDAAAPAAPASSAEAAADGKQDAEP